jgi:hypothetical protein
MKKVAAASSTPPRQSAMVQMPKSANGPIEGVRSLARAGETKARRYRSLRNAIAIAYPIAGLKLATRDCRQTMRWHCQEMRERPVRDSSVDALGTTHEFLHQPKKEVREQCSIPHDH